MAWVLKTLYDNGSNTKNLPPVGILPLGTGNDLSNMLNWGKGIDSLDTDDWEALMSFGESVLRKV